MNSIGRLERLTRINYLHQNFHRNTRPVISSYRPSDRCAHTKSGPPQKDSNASFMQKFWENFKNEWSQDKGVKESLDKFTEETKKLEEAEAIVEARNKFRKVSQESIKDVNEVFQTAKDSIKSQVEKAIETEVVKKTIKFGDTLSTKAKDAAEGISRQGEYFKDSTAFKKISDASKKVEKEMNEADIISSLYVAPKELLKRAERTSNLDFEHRQVKPNDNVKSVELHKDSKWSQSWKKFKDSNPYMNRVFEYKIRYDESDNPVIRVTRNFVDRVSDLVGGLFQTTDMSNVMTEICKVEPKFEIQTFLKDCEKFIIPTILESMCQNRLDVLSDWCHEAVFNVLSHPQKEAQKLGLRIHSRIIDIQNVDLAMGKIMDQGPVLVLTLNVQQTNYVSDAKGNITEGDPDKVVQNTYVMAFCRDQDDPNPNTAWRLIDVAMQQSQFMF